MSVEKLYAMTLVALLSMLAFFNNIDSGILSLAIAVISGLAGYEIGKRRI